jgi:hypothetical protein
MERCKQSDSYGGELAWHRASVREDIASPLRRRAASMYRSYTILKRIIFLNEGLGTMCSARYMAKPFSFWSPGR